MRDIVSPLDGPRSPLGPRRGRFSPAVLFRAGEQGFWAEVSPNTTWTDTARTTPPTVGDTVASWQLNTASGVIYATQATAPRRPTLRQDGSLYYLDFEVDDALVTPTITPGTDKAQVFAGVRKDSDAALGIAIEYSATVDTNNGAFNLAAPVAAGTANYTFRSKGTSGVNASYTNTAVAAPITNVLSGLGDISGDRSILRINGTQVAQGTGDQGTGNYLAHPLFIGARAGTSLFFNGRIYSLIVRFGANLTAGQIDNAEAWTAGKAGVVL